MDESDRENQPTTPGWDAPHDPWHGDAEELAEAGVIQVGDLLTTATRAVASNFVPFAAIALLLMSPAVIAGAVTQEWMKAHLWSLQTGLGDYEAARQGVLLASVAALAVVLLQTVLQFFAQAAIMHGTVEFMAGRRAETGRSLAAGFSHAPTILALAVLNTLAIGFGMLCCIIPGVVLTCVLFASVPAAVVERIGPIAAMQRSAELTAGHRLTIFLVSLLVGVVFVAFALTIGCGLGAAGGDSPAPDAMPLRIVGYVVDWGSSTLLAMLQSALAAVFYARARGIRDEIDADALAKVFE